MKFALNHVNSYPIFNQTKPYMTVFNMKKSFYPFLFLLLGFPLIMNAQSCGGDFAQQYAWSKRMEPAGIPVTSKINNPSKSKIGNQPVPTYMKSGFKVLVMERKGDQYKVANSDLGRTMHISSPNLELEENNHYLLVMRRLPDHGDSGENSTEQDQSADWEVLSGRLRYSERP